MQRVDEKQLEALFEMPDRWSKKSHPAGGEIAPTIGIDDFARLWTYASRKSSNAKWRWRARPSCCS